MGETHFKRPKEQKSVLWRNSSYRSACSGGTMLSWEAHHIACNHAVEGRDTMMKQMSKEDRRFVEDCLWITDWDLNNKGNLVGLPKNKQYRLTDGKAPANKCSHQVDHNTSDGYTNECKTWLKDNVWDTLREERKEHEIDPKDIKGQLKACTSWFKAELRRRGGRKGGTAKCWKNRFEDDHTEKWYYPFSMANDGAVRHRSPGVSLKKLEGIFKMVQLALG
jgi:hypothetical protein